MKSKEEFIQFLERFAFLMSLFGLLGIISDFGFEQAPRIISLLGLFYISVLIVNIFATIGRYFHPEKRKRKKAIIFDSLALIFSIWVIYHHFEQVENYNFFAVFYDDVWLRVAVVLTFIRDFSELKFSYKTSLLNPAQLLVFSFIIIILIGATLLVLPTATYEGISFLDALFTATSAVCITGLIVVDTSSHFTEIGQTIIMILIQLGGLGILTFASYFSYFFKGGSTYENQLALSSMTYSQKVGEVFTVIKQILSITIIIESIAAILIFFSVDSANFNTFSEHIFFSVFHAISSFCQAGFSTLPDSFHTEGYQFNYSLHAVVLVTFYIGGIGFPIVSNMVSYVKYMFIKLFSRLKSKQYYKPWVLNLNSRMNLITTLSISAVAFILFFIFEYNNTLAEHSSIFGKIITALFGSSTPRSAGLNTIDTSALNFSSIMLIFLLMWIGASPASTGGGIKTSTFAIATLNIFSLARGKNKIEIFRREIANVSVRRAFAIISLSLIAIGCGIILLSITDSEKDLLSIAFECFSAYSTVGLSLGITGDLSDAGKLVIITSMLIGRVTLLTIIQAIFKPVKPYNYKYPAEDITMN